MANVLKPIYLVDTVGEFARLPDGAVINAGGVAGPTFSVGGKPLLFADGTATDGTTVQLPSIDFQTVYQNSVGEAFIDFTSGKDFILQAVNDKQFRFDADTGLVTITGDLVVIGTATTVINTEISSHKVHIHPTAGDYVPLLIEPVAGVTPTENVVDVKVAYDGASVFWINAAGTTNLQNLTITSGQVNGVDIAGLQQQLIDHANLSSESIKHTAAQISFDDSEAAPVIGETVQAAIQSIATSLAAINPSNVTGFEHVQETPSTTWTVVHGQNTRKAHVTLWDTSDEMIMADTVTIADANTIVIRYNTAIAGRAVLVLF
jgi:hypothetical protein